MHAGFPKIDAVGRFRQNVVEQLDTQQEVLDKEVKDMKKYLGKHSIRTPTNKLKTSRNTKSPLTFDAYLDKSGYDSAFRFINKEIKMKMVEALEAALTDASFKTIDEVVNMRRAFKGKHSSSVRVKRDLYDVIGNSLWWGRQEGQQKNQFISFNAGSYDDSQSYNEVPTGVTGSRGANLTELTAEGTGSFRIDSHPLGGTKRLVNHLKNARGG